jgi:beta-fructofuranosidase
VNHENGRLKLRLILDRFSVEAFINDGEKVMSATVGTPQSAQEISFFCDGKTRFNVRMYTLMV